MDAVQTILRAGPETIVGEKKMIVHVGPKALTSTFIEALPVDRTILSVSQPEFTSASDFAALTHAVELGFKISLENVGIRQGFTDPFKVAKYLKIDTRDGLDACNRDTLFALKHPGRRAIALGVHSYETLQKCWAIGFEFFQGQFAAEPVVVPGRALPQNRAVLFQLLTKLQDHETKLDNLEMLVASDVVLSYRLMRLVNSACLGLNQSVDSIRQALMLLGMNRVASLVSMLAMTSMKDKPQELTMTGMIRGKLCEVLAKELKFAEPERFFTLGLLSVLPAMFDLPMVKILDQLPLSKDMAEALAVPGADSAMARVLQTVLAYEEGIWEDVVNIRTEPSVLCQAYIDSIGWAQSAIKTTAA